MSDSDLQLLGRYCKDKAEEAFEELVRRHADLVYSAALRQVHSPQLAQEIAQCTFTDLARGAARLGPNTILSAWLYDVTRRTAIDVVRSESRRQAREQVATQMAPMNEGPDEWKDIAPLLDEVMQTLEPAERTAILLRYFENRSLREVGKALDITEEAARKRVSRGIESLQAIFAKRGVTLGVGTVTAALSVNAIQAAPTGFAAAMSHHALVASAAKSSPVFLKAVNAILARTAPKPLTALLVVGVLSAGVYPAWKTSVANGVIRSFQQREEAMEQQLQSLQDERGKSIVQISSLKSENETLTRATADLPRLRAEVAKLKGQVKEAGEAAASAASQTQGAVWPNDVIEVQKLRTQAKSMDALLNVFASLEYAKEHRGLLPASWADATPYYARNANGPPTGTNVFEMVYEEPVNYFDLLKLPKESILIREDIAWRTPAGTWAKAYGFASGRSEVHFSKDGDFATWEKQFNIPNPRPPRIGQEPK